MNTTARSPVRCAAHAVAAPWLPVEAVTTADAPRSRYASSDGSAPRHLNAPSSCRSSRFSSSRRPAASPGGASSRGVEGPTARHTNLAAMSTATDPALESAAWDLEPLVDGRGAAGVEQLLTEARDRAAAFAERHRGRL